MRNPFPSIFYFFAAATAFLGVGMAVIAGGDVFDVRGLLAVLCIPMAVLHLHCARSEKCRGESRRAL